MKYREVISTPDDRFRLPPSHPILATLTIDPANWCQLQRLDDDNPATRILSHHNSKDGLVVVIACATERVRRRLEDAWG